MSNENYEEIQLKGGAITRDRRLDRVPQYDENNRRFGIREATPDAQRSYTWAISGQLDQGVDGACVGFAWAQELMARPVGVLGITDTFARERLYWPAQHVDPWEGGSYPGAQPYYEGTSILSGVKVLQRDFNAFQEYRWAFSVDEVISGVGFTGPCVLGLNWHAGMMDIDRLGYIRPHGPLLGGHAILCRGVSLRYRRFLLQNSWGADWGYKGYCFLDFDELGSLLEQDGEACFPVGRRPVTI